jgi:hypothetical protein
MEEFTMLRFTAADLHPVLSEARANGCRIILVKDQGVYMMSEKGARNPDGRQRHLAYAVGCNPDVDDFDQWYERAHAELGGDDFAEYFDVGSLLFCSILDAGADLLIRATRKYLYLEVAKRSSDR